MKSMDDGTAIRVQSVSKSYRIFERPQDRFKQMVLGRFRNYYQDFWAVRDVSFETKRGQALGIIGRNGSGKSTLLELIVGTLRPTAGAIDVNGRVAALLELGAGFSPEFTGRENVYMNASLMGMTRDEIDQQLPKIVDFAEIGDFIDQPVKTYSSGMFVRLAFSVQIHMEPDVLIVDEALSVGDIFFQQKCFRRIREMRDRGVTLLFVSHDMTAVRHLCDRALLLQSGRVAFEGAPEDAVSRYFSAGPVAFDDVGHRCRAMPVRVAGETLGLRTVTAETKREIVQNNILPLARDRHGDGRLRMVAASLVNDEHVHAMHVALCRPIRIRLLLRAEGEVLRPSTGIHLHDRMGLLVFAAGTRQLGVELPDMKSGDEVAIELTLVMAVQPGEYTFSLGCGEPSPEGPNVGIVHDRAEGIGPLLVYANHDGVMPFYGVAQLPMSAVVAA